MRTKITNIRGYISTSKFCPQRDQVAIYSRFDKCLQLRWEKTFRAQITIIMLNLLACSDESRAGSSCRVCLLAQNCYSWTINEPHLPKLRYKRWKSKFTANSLAVLQHYNELMSLFGHLPASHVPVAGLWRPPGGQNCDIHLRLYYMRGWDCNETTKPQASSIGMVQQVWQSLDQLF